MPTTPRTWIQRDADTYFTTDSEFTCVNVSAGTDEPAWWIVLVDNGMGEWDDTDCTGTTAEAAMAQVKA